MSEINLEHVHHTSGPMMGNLGEMWRVVLLWCQY
jgi:hypothetical protein